MTEDEILADLPDLTSEDIHACLCVASDRERRLASLLTRNCFADCTGPAQEGGYKPPRGMESRPTKSV